MTKRCLEKQIFGFIREAEQGMAIKAFHRKHGLNKTPYYLSRGKFDGMTVSDAPFRPQHKGHYTPSARWGTRC